MRNIRSSDVSELYCVSLRRKRRFENIALSDLFFLRQAFFIGAKLLFF